MAKNNLILTGLVYLILMNAGTIVNANLKAIVYNDLTKIFSDGALIKHRPINNDGWEIVFCDVPDIAHGYTIEVSKNNFKITCDKKIFEATIDNSLLSTKIQEI